MGAGKSVMEDGVCWTCQPNLRDSRVVRWSSGPEMGFECDDFEICLDDYLVQIS